MLNIKYFNPLCKTSSVQRGKKNYALIQIHYGDARPRSLQQFTPFVTMVIWSVQFHKRECRLGYEVLQHAYILDIA